MRKLKLDELNRLRLEEFRALEKYPVTIVLDNIRSGLNVGSFFRTADAFAIEQIYLCGYTPAPPHPEIFKTAIGATEAVQWSQFPDITEALTLLHSKDYRCIGIEQTDISQELDQIEVPQNGCALIFGNEVNGLSKTTFPYIHEVWEIPQFGTKHSLNVSICGGIVLWEVIRQLRSGPRG